MSHARRYRRFGVACLACAALFVEAALFAQAALAEVVTVAVTSASGGAVADTVIVFDPLDTKPPATQDEASIDQIDQKFVPRVGVVDSPYFAKTTGAGTATLTMPPGRYRLRAWHPYALAEIPPQELTVAAAPLDIPLKIQMGSEATAVVAWPE